MRNRASDQRARPCTSEWLAEATVAADTAWAERSQRARFDLSAMAVRRCNDPAVVAFTLGPLPLQCALAALERQTELAAPAKLARFGGDEPVLLAEVGWRQATSDDAERRARDALGRACQWLCGETAGDPDDGAATLASFVQTAKELGWPATEATPGVFRLDVHTNGWPHRIFASALGCNALRLALPSCVLRVRDAQVARALALFALEANARLRFARLAMPSTSGERARVSWDVIVPAQAPPDTLASAVEALTVARDETERALRALGTPAIADAFLNAPERSGQTSTM